jgi:hypothetical protein
LARLAKNGEGLTIAEPLRADYEPRSEDDELEKLLETIRKHDARDWHAFWGDMPLSERRRLILKAGRRDLIDPATCARFGITED